VLVELVSGICHGKVATKVVPLKSHGEEKILGLFRALFVDLSAQYPASVKSLQRDFDEFLRRVKFEGFSFATKTLPKLGNAFDLALAEGHLHVPRDFKRSHENRAIPAFLQALFKELFDEAGHLVPDPEPDTIKSVRQVLFLAYKYELPFTEAQKRAVIARFHASEDEISRPVQEDEFPTAILSQAERLLRVLFRRFNPLDIRPRHGPGAVASGEKGDGKWKFSTLYPQIHRMYPYHEYYMVGCPSSYLFGSDFHDRFAEQKNGISKVVLVPKDSRGPRLISCEPLEFQWIQQGLNRELVDLLESHWLTRGHINFQDQKVNQKLATVGSVTGEWATIDLKDASDRVSRKLVACLFSSLEMVRDALYATRSTHTMLPDGSIHELQKFAPMGSAVCFSLESIVFWVLSVCAVQKQTKGSLYDATRCVYVYGDDLIVPTDCFTAVKQVLESFRLVVNDKKSCYKGKYRESCGVQSFNGFNVTPIRCSTLWSSDSTDCSCFTAYISYANEFASRGYTEVSRYIFEALERQYGPIPWGYTDSSYPCRWCDNHDEILLRNAEKFPLRWHAGLHRFQFRVKTVISRQHKSKLEGWPRLLRQLSGGGGEDPSVYVLPRNTKIVKRWRSI
jgi:hypothetical protein